MFGRLAEKLLARLPSRRTPGAALVAVSARGLTERREGVERLRPWGGIAAVDAIVQDTHASGGQALVKWIRKERPGWEPKRTSRYYSLLSRTSLPAHHRL